MLISGMLASTSATTAQDIYTDLKGKMIAGFNVGYGGLGITKLSGNEDINLSIDAPMAIHISISYFLTNNIAIQSSLGSINGDFKFNSIDVKIANTAEDRFKAILRSLNFILQYHNAVGSKFKPYMGIG